MLPRLPYEGAVDADGHVLEPPDLWYRLLELRFRDRPMGIRRDADGLEQKSYPTGRERRGPDARRPGRAAGARQLGVALERLANAERDIAALAVETGFAHHSHFSARFRSAFGITPTEAREILTQRKLEELRAVLVGLESVE